VKLTLLDTFVSVE